MINGSSHSRSGSDNPKLLEYWGNGTGQFLMTCGAGRQQLLNATCVVAVAKPGTSLVRRIFGQHVIRRPPKEETEEEEEEEEEKPHKRCYGSLALPAWPQALFWKSQKLFWSPQALF